MPSCGASAKLPVAAGGQVKVWPVEEHSRMTEAVCSHYSICDSFFADGGGEESADNVVVTRVGLTPPFEFTPMVPPTTESMQDDDLIPEYAVRVNSLHIPDGKIKSYTYVSKLPQPPDIVAAFQVRRERSSPGGGSQTDGPESRRETP